MPKVVHSDGCVLIHGVERSYTATGNEAKSAVRHHPPGSPPVRRQTLGLSAVMLRGCDFFDLQAFLRPLRLLFSVSVCEHIQKSHKL